MNQQIVIKTSNFIIPNDRLIIYIISFTVFICYLPVLNNGFVWDDTHNLIDNIYYRGFTLSNLHWMFTTFYDANYHPLAWLTLGFDFTLWGMNPYGYHLTNLMFHVLNSILFFFLIVAFLKRIPNTGSDIKKSGIGISAGAGALFFALHPLRVESVSWISTRGDLLCAFFYMLTIIAYLNMIDAETDGYRKKWFRLSLFFFLLSLMSRAWGITLPVVLVILDVYPFQRLVWKKRFEKHHKKLMKEKIPFLLLSLVAAVLSLLAKKSSMKALANYGLIDRFIQTGYGLFFYLWKTFFPFNLSPLYLLKRPLNLFLFQYCLVTLLILGIIVLLFIKRYRWPWGITAFLCYAVIISPLLGFVQSGPQLVADRYTYISCMPFGILFGIGVFKLWFRYQEKRLPSAVLIVMVMFVVFITMGILTFHQTKVWKNDRSVWDHVIQLDHENYIAYNNRGVLRKEKEKDFVGAMKDYNAAIRLNPLDIDVYYNRGLLRETQGDITGAVSDYSEDIKLNPEHEKSYNNRGGLRKKLGDFDGAMSDLNMAIKLKPFSPEAYANRAAIKKSRNDLKGALQDFRKALEVAPANWQYKFIVKKIIVKINKKAKKHSQNSQLLESDLK